MAGNGEANFLTRMQGWDYRLGINGVKRMQAAYNSALVAQGAFSAYWLNDIRAVDGWPDAIGEDIVLTWTLMLSRGIVQYEPTAVAFTNVPERRRHFMRQRSRWARGMFEVLRSNPPLRQPRVLAKLVSGIDYLVPFLDIGYIFFWVPGPSSSVRLSADRLVVVDARDSGHVGDLWIAAPLAGAKGVRPVRFPAPAQQGRIPGLPVHLSDTHLVCIAARLLAVPVGNYPSLEVTSRCPDSNRGPLHYE